MTNEITPPPELVQQWDDEAEAMFRPEYQQHIATQAARWGADAELEACCEWFQINGWHPDHPNKLRAHRRPKPPTLKKQALAKLPKQPENMASYLKLTPGDVATIRRAINQLPDE